MLVPFKNCFSRAKWNKTARPEQSKRVEAEENDVKNKFIEIIEIEKSK